MNLKELIKKGESEKVEFKKSLNELIYKNIIVAKGEKKSRYYVLR